MTLGRIDEEALVLRGMGDRSLGIDEISRIAGGIYLADVSDLLVRLISEGKISRDGERFRVAHRLVREHSRVEGDKLILLPPHPANLDWRFTPATAARLAAMGLSEARIESRSLLIGTPSVLAEWHRLAADRPVALIDISPAMVESVNLQLKGSQQHAIQFDMCRPLEWLEDNQYEVCICDPPWYREHYLGCLGLAAAALKVGSKFFLSVLPPMVRPGADADRNWIFEQAAILGFRLACLEPEALQYSTPEYERNSLASVGLVAPNIWRHGDLASFVKIADVGDDVRSAILSPLNQMHVAEQDFEEIRVGEEVIRIRGPFNDLDFKPELIAIEPHDILQSVSRRHPGRKRIDLWFSDNRVFGLIGRAAFRDALALLSRGTGAVNFRCKDANLLEALRLIEPLLAKNGT